MLRDLRPRTWRRNLLNLYCWFIAALALAPVAVLAAEPQWIWTAPEAAAKAPGGGVYFRKTFVVPEPAGGMIEITADNRFELLVNGRELGGGDVWQERRKFDLAPLLVPGQNLLAVHAVNDGESPAGLAVRAVVKTKGGPDQEIVSDASWKFTLLPTGNWARPEFETGAWKQAVELGAYGKTPPWGAAGAIVAGAAASVLNKPKSTEAGQFQLRDGDRVVFLGGAMVERMQTRNYLEALLTQANPSKNLTFRNLGWSGDTVWGDARAVFGSRSDGFKRLVADLALCQPTVVVVCYGANEAHAGEAGLPDFQSGLSKLLDALEGTGARLVLVGARKHEFLGAPLPNPAAFNASLKLYNEALGYAAASRGHKFIDLYDFAPGRQLTENGLHFTPHGEFNLAAELAVQLGAAPQWWKVNLDLQKNSLDAFGLTVLNWQRKEHGLVLELQPRALPPPQPTAGAPPPAPPPPDALIRIAGLAPGNYSLRQDGAVLANASAAEWAAGKLVTVPQAAQQGAQLLAAIHEKNLLFFHRHRPQNETYLFLFRKHEQGNNAVEIPQFDPLIAAQEKSIAALRQPPKLSWELVESAKP